MHSCLIQICRSLGALLHHAFVSESRTDRLDLVNSSQNEQIASIAKSFGMMCVSIFPLRQNIRLHDNREDTGVGFTIQREDYWSQVTF